MDSIVVFEGNCLERLKDIPTASINTCITSPPYFNLRDYGEEEQLGLEDTPEDYVNNLVNVFREVKRVLRDDGTVWLNLGDSYSSGSRKTTKSDSLKINKNYGLQRAKVNKNIKPKDLIGIPFRVAFALQEDGWYLRQDIIWHKPNPMPESVTDRCTKSHEYIFLLTKNERYYYDHIAIKEDALYPEGPNSSETIRKGSGLYGMDTRKNLNQIGAIEKRNKRSVWTITNKPFAEAHFATFPMDLIEPCVLAGCPQKVCVNCGEPYKRELESKSVKRNELPKSDSRYRPRNYIGSYEEINGKGDAGFNLTVDKGFKKMCECTTNEYEAGTVLDPFAGSGTTAQAALKYSRKAVMIELNAEYIAIMKKRLKIGETLFSTEWEVR